MFLDIYTMYLISALIVLPCILISVVASSKVHSTFAAFDRLPTSSDWTGSDTARMLLEKNGIYGVAVHAGKGHLTDNFNPRAMTITLSESTYSSNSVAAVAVCAHEVGHVVQREEGYLPYKLRSVLVPVTNIGSSLAIPLVLLGVLLEIFLVASVGNIVVFAGVCAYGLSFIFTLVTLPVELNASSRAKKMLAETGVLQTDEEKKGASKVLSAAAMTYVASSLVSLLYFIRFLVYVIMLTGRNRK